MSIIRTDRLSLRLIQQGDFEDLYELFTCPKVMEHYPKIKTKIEVQRWLENTHEHYRKYNCGLWAVTLKDDTYIGHVGLVNHDIPELTEYELGYMLKSSFWKYGFATEAAIACKEYAKSELGLKSLISIIDANNARSQGVAKRVGMKLEESKYIEKFGKDLSIYRIKF